jgi:hypothetical protein
LGTRTGDAMAQRLVPTALVVGSIALGIAYAGARFRAEIGPVPEPAQTIIISSAGSHKVTPEMLATTTGMTEQVAPAFRAEGSDGKDYSLAEMSRDGPMALLFIKDGCPCSVAAGPFYNRLHEAYGHACGSSASSTETLGWRGDGRGRNRSRSRSLATTN